MCAFKPITKGSKGVAITVAAEDEDTPIEGNASAVDDVTDKRKEDEIKAQLRAGNQWAWCTIRVTVTYRDEIEASAYLGACSYADERAFRHDNGTFASMVDEAIGELNRKLAILCAPEVG